MSTQNSALSIRETFEKVFAAVASLAIITFVAVGTFSMCGVDRIVA